MSQETIVLIPDYTGATTQDEVNTITDTLYTTAQTDINANFTELYAASPPSLTGNALKYLRVNAGETAIEWATVSGGVTDFTDLGDVPASYSGQALKFVRVNAGETALEFTTSSASVAWGGITGTLSDQTDLQAALDAKQSIQDYGNMFLLMGA
jgi:hypothetical protein